jgi:CHAT domain-containing protein/tetratricopeptide (TPR) repeat protein
MIYDHEVNALFAQAERVYISSGYHVSYIKSICTTLTESVQAHCGPNSIPFARAANLAARMLRRSNDFDGALQWHEVALAIRRRVLGARHALVAESLHNITVTMEAAGRKAEALTCIQEVLNLRRTSGQRQSMKFVTSLALAVRLSESSGDVAAAQSLFEELTAHISSNDFSDDAHNAPDESSLCTVLSALKAGLAANFNVDAYPYSRFVVLGVERYVRDALTTLAVYEQLDSAKAILDALAPMLQLSSRARSGKLAHDVVGCYLKIELLGRGRQFLRRGILVPRAGNKLENVEAELAANADYTAGLVFGATTDHVSADLRNEFASIVSRRVDLERTLSDTIAPESIDVLFSEIDTILCGSAKGSSAFVIKYVVGACWEDNSDMEHLYALVNSGTGDWVIFALGAHWLIQAKLFAALAAVTLKPQSWIPKIGGYGIMSCDAPLTQGAEDEIADLASALLHPIFNGLEIDYDDLESGIYITPSHDLHRWPFELLTLPNAAGVPLLEYAEVVYAPSALACILQRTKSQEGDFVQPEANSHLIIGAPLDASNLPPALGLVKQSRFPYLPESELEVLAVAELLRSNPLTRSHATKTVLKLNVRDARTIHIATHGIYADSRELKFRSRDTVSHGSTYGHEPDDDSSFGDWTYHVAITDPLLASALLLTPEANIPGSEALTPLEISVLPLHECRLVFLSGCATNFGSFVVTGDLLSATSAALLAGATSSVGSLWDVPDSISKDLAIAFYEKLRLGLAPATALRLAKLSIMETYPDPFLWGAFIVTSSIYSQTSMNHRPRCQDPLGYIRV